MNAHSPPVAAQKSSQWSKDVPAKLEVAFREYYLRGIEAFAAVEKLAEQVDVGGYSLDTESIVIQGKTWICPGTLFVILRYDVNSFEPVEIDDAYPMTVQFLVSNGDVSIAQVDLDISSFYD